VGIRKICRRKAGGLAALPGELDEHGPVGERQGAGLVGVDRRAISDDGTKLIERLVLKRQCYQLPLPVSLGEGDPVDRRCICKLPPRLKRMVGRDRTIEQVTFSYPTAGTSLWSRRRLQSASIRPSAVIVAATSGSETRPGLPVHGGPRDKRRQRKRSFFRQRRGEPALGRPLKPRTYQPQNDPTSVARSIDR
jgi:hypothetical protein